MNIEEKLLNVRRATRLLATYNKRVLDVARLVETELEAAPDYRFKFRWMEPTEESPGKRSTNPLSYDEWAFTPLADVSFEWSTDKNPKPQQAGEINVFIRFIADSGYTDSEDGVIDDFPPAEECESRLEVLVMGLARGTCQEAWDGLFDAWGSVPDETRWDAGLGRLAVDELDTSDDALVQYVSWKVGLEELTSEEEVESKILGSIRTSISSVGTPPAAE